MRQLTTDPLTRLALLLFAFAVFVSADSSALQLESAKRVEAAREKQLRSAGRQVSLRPGDFFVSPWLSTPSAAAIAAEPAVRAGSASLDCDPLPEPELATLIKAAAEREKISAGLLRAMIRRESAGRPCAVSDKGAQGLMQLMPGTQQLLNVASPFDPAESIRGGASYIADLLRRYKGDTKRALAAYNAGPQRVELTGPLPEFAETRAYVDAIMAELQQLEQPAVSEH